MLIHLRFIAAGQMLTLIKRKSEFQRVELESPSFVVKYWALIIAASYAQKLEMPDYITQ